MAAVIIHQETALAPAKGRQKNPVSIYLASLAPSGRRTMRGRLGTVAGLMGYADPRAVPWGEFRFEHLAAIRSTLQESYSPATVNSCLYAVRGVIRAAFNLGLLSAEDFQRLQGVKPVRFQRLPAGRSLEHGELGAIMGTCDGTPAGIRDAAVIALAYACGFRRSELASLDLGDVQADAIRVVGKGNKERLVPVANGAAHALADWVEIRGNEPGPLFVPINKGGNLQHGHAVSDQSIYNIIRKHAKQAGVECSPHDFRRSCATDLLDVTGGDVLVTQQILGHANAATTARYDRRGERAKKRAAGMLHVPYHKRESA